MAQEEEICTRISESVKMAGFLEKKGKMKIVSAWKKYWFVLEERLLLYYRSQIEYINLSPCRGSLNMGLVTTVRPGSSAGPCIIHVITRTQVVQLKAKNRATQEEWLQALLDSISLPLFTKTLKVPLIADLHGHRYSMDNIPSHDRLRKTESERSENGQKGFEYRRKGISDSLYGGSLDTVVWSKKFRTVQSPSPNIPKGKMLEKILGYVEEADAKSASDMISLIDDEDLSGLNKRKGIIDGEGYLEKEESASSDYYRALHKDKKSLSDDELNKAGVVLKSDKIKSVNREESQFERLKNAMKKTRDKAFKINKSDLERKSSTIKKRRQSFLQKVFKRNNTAGNESQLSKSNSDVDDPLYDTIENIQEQRESLISTTMDSQEVTEEILEKAENLQQSIENISIQSQNEIQKPIFGSKSILTVQAMTELKTKLKSRESIDSHIQESGASMSKELKVEDSHAPDLPPRRREPRPVSPWHDVPGNNAPINADLNFNIHQTTVKFRDDIPPNFQNIHAEFNEESRSPNEEKLMKVKGDDLTDLLEQLTELTTGSLDRSTLKIISGDDCSQEVPRLAMERRLSDPDYDIPRPHKLANLCISYDNCKSDSIEHKAEESSDTSLSFHSIEPDSLESSEKKNFKV